MTSVPFSPELVHGSGPREAESNNLTPDSQALLARDGGEDQRPLFDESQKEARRQALAQRVALIQGPPGTGKTFVGVQARLAN